MENTEEQSKSVSADPRFPNDLEQLYLSKGLAIIKQKFNATNIQEFYFKWRDIWDDNMVFRVQNSNPDYTFRAIAITIPQYFLDDMTVLEHTHHGYIVGIRIEQGTSSKTQVYKTSEIIWV